MRLTENPIATINRIQELRDRLDAAPRATGTHVSDLIFCLRKAKAREQELMPPITNAEVLLFGVGRGLQEWLTGQASGDSEVALEVGGILGTPDDLDAEGSPIEYKATYASAARDINGTPHYIDQLAAYCSMLGVDHGQLVVLYVNGYYDYLRKKPRPDAVVGERATLKVFNNHFEDWELAQWWAELQKRRNILESSNDWQQVPIEHHYTWECQYCPMATRGCPGGPGSYRNRWGSMEDGSDPSS